jgi:hypothetical protein
MKMTDTRNSDLGQRTNDQGAARVCIPWAAVSVPFLAVVLAVAGCYSTAIDNSEYAQGPAPRRMPSPDREGDGCGTYEDSLTGGQIFTMYCNYCHNAPNLSERNFANFKNVGSHMRVRANLTGKEYAKLMEFLQRWNDVPPMTPPDEPSPKRFIFSQPLNELRDQPGELPPPQKLPAEIPPGGKGAPK